MTNRTPAQLKEHYRTFQGKPEQIKKRAQRNAARKEMVKKHGKAALAGKDIDHKVPIRSGGGNGKNLRIRSIKANRGDTR
ncbi:HNH endonuclease [Methylobacterium fujisawaense]